MIPFLISIPKSGTHIIKQISRGDHCNVPYGSMIYEEDPHPQTLIDLKQMVRLGISHLPYHPEYEKALRDINARIIFLYRDPRDLMVSYYFWIKKQGYTGYGIPGLIKNVSEFIDADDPFDVMLDFWGEHIRRYIPWMYVPGVLSVKYEDLTTDWPTWLDKIAEHWEFRFGEGKDMLIRISPERCQTFRKGIIGDWKKRFTMKNNLRFIEELGDVLKLWEYMR